MAKKDYSPAFFYDLSGNEKKIIIPDVCPECGSENVHFGMKVKEKSQGLSGRLMYWCDDCGWEDENIKSESVNGSESEISETERENDRYNQEQDYLENHLEGINGEE